MDSMQNISNTTHNTVVVAVDVDHAPYWRFGARFEYKASLTLNSHEIRWGSLCNEVKSYDGE